MPKYDNVEEYLRVKLEGQRERCDELQGEIQGQHQVVFNLTKMYQDKVMQLARSRNEIGQLRAKVKELQDSIDKIYQYG